MRNKNCTFCSLKLLFNIVDTLFFYFIHFFNYRYFGSGALSGKMLLVRIGENNNINAYFGQVRLSKG